MKRTVIFLMAAVIPATADHFMPGMNEDPWRTPKWEAVFATGPFAAPEKCAIAEVTLPTSKFAEVQPWLVRGWAAVLRLDDREAERCFRLALVKSPEEPIALLGLCLANSTKPGRAAVFVRKALELSQDAGPIQKLLRAYADYYAAVGNRPDAPNRQALLQPETGSLRVDMGVEKSQKLLETIGELSAAYPEQVEIKALLVRERLRLQNAVVSPADDLAVAGRLLKEILKAAPRHPAGNCQWLHWKIAEGKDDADRLAQLLGAWPPASIRSCLAAANALESLGYAAAAISWADSAVRRASEELQHEHFQPGAMVDFHAGLEKLAVLHGSAGDLESARKSAFAAGSIPLAETLLRLNAWEAILQSETLQVKTAQNTEERAAWWHAAAISCFRLDKASEALTRLALLRDAPLRARQDVPSPTPEALERIAQLGREIEIELFLREGQKKEALASVSFLTTRPAAAVARLAFRAGDTGMARGFAAAALAARPGAAPERSAAEAVGLPLPPSNGVSTRSFPSPPPNEAAWWTAPEAPQFSLTDGVGAVHASASHRGKITVYLFFLGVACEHCMNQLTLFAKWQAAFRTAGVDLVAVSIDDESGAAATLAKDPKGPGRQPFPFPVLADPNRRVFGSYQAFDHIKDTAIHGTYLVDAAGRIAWQTTGTEPFMEPEIVLRMAKDLAPTR